MELKKNHAICNFLRSEKFVENKWRKLITEHAKLLTGGVRMRISRRSDAENFNYKAFYSLVLMERANADGNFILWKGTGYAGGNNDTAGNF